MELEAWITLATNDAYALGVLVLAHSLKAAKTRKPLVVMITHQVSETMKARLSEVSYLVQQVNVIDSEDSARLALLSRPELGITFTKLHCWTMTRFSKCVFLDADTLVIQNCDELFQREEFSAAPDVGWPDCFNSGVFVYRPSLNTYWKLLDFAVTEGSFDGGDQGLLNSFFSDWATKDTSRRLPFIYNMTSSAAYSYKPAYLKFRDNVKIVHFIGTKPWNVEHRWSYQSEHLDYWWDIFYSKVEPYLSDNDVRTPAYPAEMETTCESPDADRKTDVISQLRYCDFLAK